MSILCCNCTKRPLQQQSLTIREGTLTVGVEIGYPPMEYYDTDGKTLIGFDIELTRALADKLGLRAVYVDTDWEGILASLDTNRYDIAINITILPERQNKYNFTKPYIASSITIVALKDSRFKIEKPEDIAGYSICYQSSTTAQYFTERLSEQGVGFISYSYDKILNCFDDLALGRVDLIAVDNIVAFYYAGKENSSSEIVWQGPSDEYIGICLKKGNDALTDALNNALDELFENGTMLQISQKIFNHDMTSSAR
ncbi:MAG: ABC transporter substrate-binding protein [Treponema sp.]|nr:ABC transporter substrate-binding protein [Treponema sp.]